MCYVYLPDMRSLVYNLFNITPILKIIGLVMNFVNLYKVLIYM